MRTKVLAATLACVALVGLRARAETRWIIDAAPASIIANFNADDFDMRRGEYPNPYTHQKVYAEKEELSLVTAMPTVALGVAMEEPNYTAQVTGGIGALLNSRLGGFMVPISAAVLFEPDPGLVMGPHAMIGYFTSPTWWGEAEVEFSDAVGYMLGMQFCFGDKVSYIFSVDYLSLKFDVDSVSDGWVPSDPKELDMSGLAVQFGVRITL